MENRGQTTVFHQAENRGLSPVSTRKNAMRKIDIFNHVMPLEFFERIGDYKDIGKRMREVPMLYDLDERFRVMDRFPDYHQVLSAGMPPIEALAGPKDSPELARICN